jgi:hypothetical protein
VVGAATTMPPATPKRPATHLQRLLPTTKTRKRSLVGGGAVPLQVPVRIKTRLTKRRAAGVDLSCRAARASIRRDRPRGVGRRESGSRQKRTRQTGKEDAKFEESCHSALLGTLEHNYTCILEVRFSVCHNGMCFGCAF